MHSNFRWVESNSRIICQSQGKWIFNDSAEHWNEAVRRLLNLTADEARAWVETVGEEYCASVGDSKDAEDSDLQLEALRRASGRFFQQPPIRENGLRSAMQNVNVLGNVADCVWIHGMREDGTVAVAGNRKLQHGILVRLNNGVPARASPPEYELDYFEGGKAGVGYGNYQAQSSWRMEKAMRLVRQIGGIGRYIGKDLNQGTRLLDVGSGYGFFRKTAADHGWLSFGVEISQHGVEVAREQFGLDTFHGTLDAFASQTSESFDIITMFDTIEHVVDPLKLLRTVEGLLGAGGLCVIRTPNLMALEADIFKSYYHSLKMEHLHYFSPASLCSGCIESGLEPVFVTSESHLLQGFLQKNTARFARLLKGSDLFAVARKPMA